MIQKRFMHLFYFFFVLSILLSSCSSMLRNNEITGGAVADIQQESQTPDNQNTDAEEGTETLTESSDSTEQTQDSDDKTNQDESETDTSSQEDTHTTIISHSRSSSSSSNSNDDDSDGDGTLDSYDRCAGYSDAIDSDADGIPDGCDTDLDNDGVSDTNDVCTGYDDNADFDSDGIPDGCDMYTAPTQGIPVLSSSFGANATTENLTVYNISTADREGDSVKNIYNWFLNNISIADVNMPFEGGSNSTYTKDYSGLGNNGVVSNAVWNATAGFDGKGAYEFDKTNNKFIEITNVSVGNFTVNFTLLMWVKPKGNSDSTTPLIISRGGTSAAGGYQIFWSNVSKTTQFQLTAFSGIRSSTPPVNSVPLNSWSCLGATYNGTTMATYINGTLRRATSYATYEHANVTNTLNVHFGAVTYETAHFFNGTIDDVMLINKLLSQEQINAFCQQTRDTIVSQTTTAGETWNASITPNDGNADGITKYSNNLIIINASENNTIPIQDTPILNSTYGTNTTTENLTVYNISTFDADSDPVKNIYNWYLNNISIADVNMPFEGGSNSLYTKDYSGFENHGVVSNAVWNSTAGFDGKGAYEFDGTNSKFIETTSIPVGNFTVNFTLLMWVKPLGNSDTTTPRIIDRAGTSAAGGYHIFWTNVTQRTQFQITAFSGLRTSVPPVNSVPFNVWSCLGATYNGTTMATYINGTLRRATSYATYEEANVTNTVNVHIGAVNYETAHFFNGTIDDVMLINKLLSQEQINAFCQQNRNTIVSQTTNVGETWGASITPNDGNADGITKYSNNLTTTNSTEEEEYVLSDFIEIQQGDHYSELHFYNEDGTYAELPFAADGTYQAGEADDEPVFWGTRAPSPTSSQIDMLLYLEGETCQAPFSIVDCQGAEFLVVDGVGNVHVMQITNINYGGEHSFDFDDLTYSGDYQDNQYVSGSSTEITLRSGDTISLTLDEPARTITFTSIGSSNGAEILLQNGGSLKITNSDTSSQIFEGLRIYTPNETFFQELNAVYDSTIIWNE